jgi:hypothetical protein
LLRLWLRGVLKHGNDARASQIGQKRTRFGSKRTRQDLLAFSKLEAALLEKPGGVRSGGLEKRSEKEYDDAYKVICRRSSLVEMGVRGRY